MTSSCNFVENGIDFGGLYHSNMVIEKLNRLQKIISSHACSTDGRMLRWGNLHYERLVQHLSQELLKQPHPSPLPHAAESWTELNAVPDCEAGTHATGVGEEKRKHCKNISFWFKKGHQNPPQNGCFCPLDDEKLHIFFSRPTILTNKM